MNNSNPHKSPTQLQIVRLEAISSNLHSYIAVKWMGGFSSQGSSKLWMFIARKRFLINLDKVLPLYTPVLSASQSVKIIKTSTKNRAGVAEPTMIRTNYIHFYFVNQFIWSSKQLFHMKVKKIENEGADRIPLYLCEFLILCTRL